MSHDVLWRDTGITPKFFILDARVIFPICLWLFHWAFWTLYVALVSILILYLVQRTGMTPLACLRSIQVSLLGKRRETRLHEVLWRKRCRW